MGGESSKSQGPLWPVLRDRGRCVPLPLPPPQRGAPSAGGAGVRGVPRVPSPCRLGRRPSSPLRSAPRPPLTSGLDWRTAGPGKFESRWGERRRRAVTLNGVGSRTRPGLPAGGPAASPRPAGASETPRCRCALGGRWESGTVALAATRAPPPLRPPSVAPAEHDAPGAAPAGADGGLRGGGGGGRRAQAGAAPSHGGRHPGHRLRCHRLHVGRPDAGARRRLTHPGEQPEPPQPGHRQLRAGALPRPR